MEWKIKVAIRAKARWSLAADEFFKTGLMEITLKIVIISLEIEALCLLMSKLVQ